DNTTCPDGYSETTFNGSKICVRNNPDPEKPNPNDPNNPDYGGGGDNGSGGSEPTDGGDGSTGGSINLKPVIDAINSLKSALLGAISGISGKLDTLINVQKDTNKKLDTSNDHLDKIEDATQATSEAVGETNKKLDSIKDSIDSQTKCLDQGTGKYRECTDDDLKTGPEEDGKVSVLEKEVETNFDANIINASAQCPPPMVIRFNLLQAHEISFSYENFCYGASLARPWVIFVGMLIAFMIVTGQYKGGSDA
ncbi:virulence factor TspB C-terminal domain-related protein, partial [Acinetobacter proteolyticus]|uniref:virulence factor TspB C-terminal domain-related protein n=1 Tax=Acinetobacter proteolyticus TaxID=1776741 RepID=UPI000B14980E